jgi:AraC-like DNA-binding protein
MMSGGRWSRRAQADRAWCEVLANLPPVGHRVLDTWNIEEARTGVERYFASHEVTVLTRDQRLHVMQNYAFIGGVGVGSLVYDRPVEIDLNGGLKASYLVEIPLRGQLYVRCGGQEVYATSERGFIANPGDSLWMRWYPGTAVLTVLLDASLVRERAEACMRLTGGRGVRFDPVLDLSKGMGRAWSAQVWALIRDIEHGDGWTHDPAIAQRWAHLLMDGLLLGQSGPHSDSLPVSTSRIMPKALRTLIDQIHAHPEQSWTTADMARVARIGIRAVQKAFAHHIGTTPNAYVRRIRLARVHMELTSTDPSTATVTEIARRWRFNELGRFAAHYRGHYGESPSDTLRRS